MKTRNASRKKKIAEASDCQDGNPPIDQTDMLQPDSTTTTEKPRNDMLTHQSNDIDQGVTQAALLSTKLALSKVATTLTDGDILGTKLTLEEPVASIAVVTQEESSSSGLKSEGTGSPNELQGSTESTDPKQMPFKDSTPDKVETPNKKRSARQQPEPNQSSKKKPKKTRGKPQPTSDELEFELSWICSECKEAECIVDPSAEQLLICEGKCNRLFHFPCAGLAKLPASDEPWLCADCKECQHRCILCHEYGGDDEDVFCCERGRCGLFFHESCMTMSNIDYTVVGNADEDEPTDDATTKASVTKKLSFSCPAHWCWTCKQNVVDDCEDETGATKGKKPSKKNSISLAFGYKSEGRLFRCMECPRAYHLTCMPPLSRFHELALLCHEHSSMYKLPDLDLDNSVQKSVEATVDRKLRKAFAGRVETPTRKRPEQEVCLANVFFVGVRGDVITDHETKLMTEMNGTEGSTMSSSSLLFYLPSELKDEVHAKPPPYRHLNALKYVASNRPKRLPPSGEVCTCAKSGFTSCGDDCMNRMLGMECAGDVNGSKNPYANCSIGLTCGNRAIGQRKSAKCRPEREGGRGWGLITVDKIRAGDYVQEYGGEVIDEKTKAKRLEEWAKDHPNDPNFYIMSLQQGWYIDARNESNLARFINHSCEPNCRVLQMNVGGSLHMGIYALRDIAPGEFLSYDYQFDTRHGDKFRCRCGSRICRGSMKSGKSQATNEKKTKTELWEEAKARYERDKKYLDDVNESEARRLYLVDALVPGAIGNEEAVANGPQLRDRDFALRNRMFLWRNVVRGSDFLSRFSRRRRRSFITTPSESMDVVSAVNSR